MEYELASKPGFVNAPESFLEDNNTLVKEIIHGCKPIPESYRFDHIPHHSYALGLRFSPEKAITFTDQRTYEIIRILEKNYGISAVFKRTESAQDDSSPKTDIKFYVAKEDPYMIKENRFRNVKRGSLAGLGLSVLLAAGLVIGSTKAPELKDFAYASLGAAAVSVLATGVSSTKEFNRKRRRENLEQVLRSK